MVKLFKEEDEEQKIYENASGEERKMEDSRLKSNKNDNNNKEMMIMEYNGEEIEEVEMRMDVPRKKKKIRKCYV